MPSDFKIDVENRAVYSWATGVFTRDEYVSHMNRLQREPRFNPEFNQVVDCRNIAKMELTAEQIRELAQESAFSKRSRRAFVVSGDVQYGLSRMLASYRDVQSGQQIQVFRDLPPALAWLGLPASFGSSSPTAPTSSGPGGSEGGTQRG